MAVLQLVISSPWKFEVHDHPCRAGGGLCKFTCTHYRRRAAGSLGVCSLSRLIIPSPKKQFQLRHDDLFCVSMGRFLCFETSWEFLQRGADVDLRSTPRQALRLHVVGR